MTWEAQALLPVLSQLYRGATLRVERRYYPARPSLRTEQADFSWPVRPCEPIGLRREESLFAPGQVPPGDSVHLALGMQPFNAVHPLQPIVAPQVRTRTQIAHGSASEKNKPTTRGEENNH